MSNGLAIGSPQTILRSVVDHTTLRSDVLRNAIESELGDHKAQLIRLRGKLQTAVDDLDVSRLDSEPLELLKENSISSIMVILYRKYIL